VKFMKHLKGGSSYKSLGTSGLNRSILYFTLEVQQLVIRAINTRILTAGFFPEVGSGSSTQARMPTYVSILRIPQIIIIWRATVE
jgi:hypothetical protein